jgi:acyl-CoA thioesterase-2
MSDLPELLNLTDLGGGRFEVFQPSESAEGRDVVFSGQLIAQMLMAADAAGGDQKEVRSLHVHFSRAGTYTKPIELQVETLQNGRTFGSHTITATQDGKVLSRSMVLMNTIEPDMIRHDPSAPADVPTPDQIGDADKWQAFPGAEVVVVPGEPTIDGAPAQMFWHRFPDALASQVANQAVLSWATCGDIIGLGLRPHRDSIDFSGAHRTFSTGVIGQTLHFVDRFDVSQWNLVVIEAPKAGAGRIYGQGRVYNGDGALVAAFEQDAMTMIAREQLDFSRSM